MNDIAQLPVKYAIYGMREFNVVVPRIIDIQDKERYRHSRTVRTRNLILQQRKEGGVVEKPGKPVPGRKTLQRGAMLFQQPAYPARPQPEYRKQQSAADHPHDQTEKYHVPRMHDSGSYIDKHDDTADLVLFDIQYRK